jgi:hypothetical protein
VGGRHNLNKLLEAILNPAEFTMTYTDLMEATLKPGRGRHDLYEPTGSHSDVHKPAGGSHDVGISVGSYPEPVGPVGGHVDLLEATLNPAEAAMTCMNPLEVILMFMNLLETAIMSADLLEAILNLLTSWRAC